MHLRNFTLLIYLLYASVDHTIKIVNGSSVQKPNLVQHNSTRESRFYNVFFPLKWNPLPALPVPVPMPGPRCTTAGDVGQCLTTDWCIELPGGTPTSQVCDGGFCCLIILAAPAGVGALTVQHNMTTLTNTNGTTSTTTFRIPRASTNVCQIRVDFQRFSIAQPYSNDTNDFEIPGDCGVDQMTITGADNLVRPLVLCGNIGKEHLYLHYGLSQEISLLLNLTQSNSTYNILVTMINCDSPEAAPDGCAQFYTGSEGIIRSFNFPHQQLNNQYYSICIRSSTPLPSALATGLMWSTCGLYPDDIAEFFISGNDPSAPGGDCVGQDKITIPGSPDGVYCGAEFPRVQASVKPFVLFVEFDDIEFTPAPLALPGFCPPGFVCLPAPEVDGTCSNDTEIANCWFDLTAPDATPGFRQDSKNTGFCLRYSKIFT